jgi:hypothetical protein
VSRNERGSADVVAQALLDERFRPGLVRLIPLLEPVE